MQSLVGTESRVFAWFKHQPRGHAGNETEPHRWNQNRTRPPEPAAKIMAGPRATRFYKLPASGARVRELPREVLGANPGLVIAPDSNLSHPRVITRALPCLSDLERTSQYTACPWFQHILITNHLACASIGVEGSTKSTGVIMAISFLHEHSSSCHTSGFQSDLRCKQLGDIFPSDCSAGAIGITIFASIWSQVATH